MAILIVSHNNIHLTKKAVKSALRCTVGTYPDIHSVPVMVIDNYSKDGTREWLKSVSGLHLHSIYTKRWESLAYCWNWGIKYLSLIRERILVLNNDVEIDPMTYRTLAGLELPFVTGISVRTQKEMEIFKRLVLVPSPHPDFSCFMIHRDTYKKVGPFDEEYWPAYYEDNDYHVRIA